VTGTDARLLAAAHAIERTPAFRATFTPREPPLATTHDAALEFAHAALGAAAPPVTGTAVSIPPQAIVAALDAVVRKYGAVTDTDTDMIHLAIEAAAPFLAAGQRERDAQLAGELWGSRFAERLREAQP
jgi:hypothetical protein